MSRINCHSAFKHYEMFHGNAACCGGNSYGSVFNTTYNINCGGHNGGFWGGFGMGLGACFGNLFSGFMGNMGFGGFGGGMGFGFPSFGSGMSFGFPSFGGGNWFGGGSSNRVSDSHSSSKTTSCNCKGCGNDNGKTNSKNNEDKDQPKLSDLIKRVNALKVDKTTGKTVDPTDVAELRKELESLKETPIDNVNGTNNKDHYARLLDDLNKSFPIDNTKDGIPAVAATTTNSTPTVAPTAETAQGNEDTVTIDGQPIKLSELTPKQVKDLNDKGALIPEQLANLTDAQKALLKSAQNNTATTPWDNITWNSATVPSGFTTPSAYTDVNSDDAKNITAENLKRAHDTGKPIDVVNTNGAEISDAKYNGTNFPHYLQITDSKSRNYKCIGTDASGRAYYTTPDSDTNKNVYVLVKQGNEYVLYQDERLIGQNKGDLQ